jgi:hypothetical protein
MIWLTKPHPKANQCVVVWRNMFTLQKMCPITSIDSFYNPDTKELKMGVGDEMGYVRIQDLTQITQQLDLKPENIVENNTKRNPWRIFPLEKAESSSTTDDTDNASEAGSSGGGDFLGSENDPFPILEEGCLVQEG